jgi:hypothetical protein
MTKLRAATLLTRSLFEANRALRVLIEQGTSTFETLGDKFDALWEDIGMLEALLEAAPDCRLKRSLKEDFERIEYGAEVLWSRILPPEPGGAFSITLDDFDGGFPNDERGFVR